MLLPDGSTIRGLFEYNPGISYTYQDFVIESNLIYLCTSVTPIVGVTPSSALTTEFIEYSLINSVVDVNDYVANIFSTKSIPTSLLQPIVNYYLGGLKGDREIVKLENGFDLNTITSGFKAYVKNDCLGLPINLNQTTPLYIFDCYKNGSDITQTLVDYQTPNLYVRTFDTVNNIWNSWTSLAPSTNIFNSLTIIGDITNYFNGLAAGFKTIVNNYQDYYHMKIVYTGPPTGVRLITNQGAPGVVLHVEVVETGAPPIRKVTASFSWWTQTYDYTNVTPNFSLDFTTLGLNGLLQISTTGSWLINRIWVSVQN